MKTLLFFRRNEVAISCNRAGGREWEAVLDLSIRSSWPLSGRVIEGIGDNPAENVV
jgi:hypothetical protein